MRVVSDPSDVAGIFKRLWTQSRRAGRTREEAEGFAKSTLATLANQGTVSSALALEFLMGIELGTKVLTDDGCPRPPTAGESRSLRKAQKREDDLILITMETEEVSRSAAQRLVAARFP
jgi:hypothetical protein